VCARADAVRSAAGKIGRQGRDLCEHKLPRQDARPWVRVCTEQRALCSWEPISSRSACRNLFSLRPQQGRVRSAPERGPSAARAPGAGAQQRARVGVSTAGARLSSVDIRSWKLERSCAPRRGAERRAAARRGAARRARGRGQGGAHREQLLHLLLQECAVQEQRLLLAQRLRAGARVAYPTLHLLYLLYTRCAPGPAEGPRSPRAAARPARQSTRAAPRAAAGPHLYELGALLLQLGPRLRRLLLQRLRRPGRRARSRGPARRQAISGSAIRTTPARTALASVFARSAALAMQKNWSTDSSSYMTSLLPLDSRPEHARSRLEPRGVRGMEKPSSMTLSSVSIPARL